MRTDAVAACTRCALRFAPATSCPSCQRRSVLDLRDAAARRRAAAELETLGPRGRRLRRLQATYRAGIPIVGAAGLATWLALGFPGFVAGGLAVAALPFALAALDGPLERRTDRRVAALRALEPPAQRRLVLHDDAGSAEAPAARPLAGRLHARGSLTAPLSGARCLGYVLVGEGPTGQVADGVLAPGITVTTDDGQVDVSGPVRLEMGTPPPAPLAGPPAGELATFLATRGALLRPGPVVLAEALLLDGAAVTLVGEVSEQAVVASYRHSMLRRVVRGTTKAPVSIRASEA